MAWVALAFTFGSGCTQQAEPQRLHLAIWSNYAPAPVVQEFEQRTGIRVSISNYSSNEELLARLQAGATGYDLAVPSDYMVFIMRSLGLLEALDAAKTQPLLAGVLPKLKGHAFDPTSQYSVPFTWGTTGIAVNRRLYPGRLQGWADLFSQPGLRGKVTLLDDSREVIAAALRVLGRPINTRSEADLADAKRYLIAARPQIKGYTSEPKASLESGDTVAAQIFSTDGFQARAGSKDPIEYVYPVEGGTFWIDHLVIPKGARNRDAAYRFMAFALEAKRQAEAVGRIYVAPAAAAAVPLLEARLRKELELDGGSVRLKRFELMEDLGPATQLWDRVWTELKAH